MNVKLITFANYSGSAKTSDTSKGLKYGDLEIKLINDKYYFVHKNGAIIDNIQTILMKSGPFKGLMSTMPTSTTEELINYAPSMNLLINLVLDFVKREELQNGTFAATLKSLTVKASAINQKSVQVSYKSDLIYLTGYSLIIKAANKNEPCFDITNDRTNKVDYVFFDYKEPNINNYSCIMRFGQKSDNQGQLKYDNSLHRLELGTSSNKDILILNNDKTAEFKDNTFILKSDLANNDSVYFCVGKSKATNESANFRYVNDATMKYMSLGFYNNDDLIKLFTDGTTTFINTLTVPSLIINKSESEIVDVGEFIDTVINDYVTKENLTDSSMDININTVNGCLIATSTYESITPDYPFIPVVKNDGVMEIGRYIDFHYTETHDDKSARLECTGKDSWSFYNGSVNVKNLLVDGGTLNAKNATIEVKNLNVTNQLNINSTQEHFIRMFNSKLSNGQGLYFVFGKVIGVNQCATIRFVYDNTNSALQFGFAVNDDVLSLYNDNTATFKGDVTVPNLNITNQLNINSTNSQPVRLLNNELKAGEALYVIIGKTIAANSAASIRYVQNLTVSYLDVGFVLNDDVIRIYNNNNIRVKGDIITPSMTLNNQNITKISNSSNYDFNDFSDNEMLTALCVKNLFNTRPPIQHTHLTEDITNLKETIETSNYSTLTVGTLTNTTINTETVNVGTISASSINLNNESLSDVIDSLHNNLTTKADKAHEHEINDIYEAETEDFSEWGTTQLNQLITHSGTSSYTISLPEIMKSSTISLNGVLTFTVQGTQSTAQFNINLSLLSSNIYKLELLNFEPLDNQIIYEINNDNRQINFKIRNWYTSISSLSLSNPSGQIIKNKTLLSDILNSKANNGHTHNTTDINNLKDFINNLIDIKRGEFVDDAFKALYPVGSIYISLKNLAECGAVRFGQTFMYEWHDCIWEYIEGQYFLKNGDYKTGNESGAGETGGAPTHSHTIDGHQLKESEVPSKTFRWRDTDYRRANTNYMNVGVTEIMDTPKWSSGSSDYLIQKELTISYGGNGKHNHDCLDGSNIPPYLTVYMYKRTI